MRLTTEVESESPNFLVKSSRPGLDGRAERYVFVVRVTVAEGELQAGDAIRVVYGDTRGGSRGLRAAIVSTRPEPILAAVDRDGGGAFEPLSHEATITAHSGIAAALRLARILLDFTVDGEPMGGDTTAAGPPRFHVAAHGTDVIESMQVLRFSKADGGFSVIYDLQPNALDFAWSGVDGGFRDDAIYYVRLRQRGHVRDRMVMAWSSPIRVTRGR